MAARIGICFDGFKPFHETLELANEAAAAGAESVWMADHLGYREAILSCLGFALAVPKVKVVPTAVSPYLRHPMPVAMQMSTLAEAAPGRAALAVGIGNPLFLGEAGEGIEKPVRIVREFVEALRALWSGQPVEMEAARFRLKGARMMFSASAPIPIYLAPMREQMLRLAGRMANGVVLSAGISAGYARHSLAIMAKGAEQAGRPASDVLTAGCLFFMASREPKRAIEEVRRKLAFVLRNRFLDESLAFTGIPLDQAAIIAAIAERDFEGASRLVPDDAVEAFAVAGSARACCDKLRAFADAGIEELVLLVGGEGEDRLEGLKVIREFTAK